MKKILFVIINCFILMGCEKFFMDDIPKNTPQENFEYYWSFAKETYTFFDYKHINWDSVKTVYQNKISSDMTDDSLFNLLAEMTEILKDGHSSLMSNVRKYQYYFFLDRPANFDSYMLHKNYLEPNRFEVVGPFKIMEIGTIGYLYYSSFTDEFTEDQLDYIFNKFINKAGVIVDIRGNTGGDAEYINPLVGRFTDKEVLVGYNQFKNGPGKNDYTDTIPFFVRPSGKIRFTGKVVLLTNRMVYSASHYAALHFKALPNVKLIGDITGGGGGIPRYTELPNGWIFSCSSSIQTTPEGFITEGGISPTIYETITSAEDNKDGILERAISEILHE